MCFLSRVPCTIIGWLMVVAWLTDSGSLLVRRWTICDLIPKGVVAGMGSFKFTMPCNLEQADEFGIF